MSEEYVIEERDGERMLVDDAGEEQVCRRDTGRNPCRIYHRIDLTAFADGDIRPACRCPRYADGNWLIKPRITLTGVWSGCEYQACFGDTLRMVTEASSTHYNLLTEMSVEKFEQAGDETGH